MPAFVNLAAAGFDLVHAFDAAIAPWLAHDRGALLVGNTRALWAPFCAAMTDPALAAERDPLDRYTERTLEAAYPTAKILYAHRSYDGAFLPFQQLAVAAGLAALAPTHLLVHPIHGPWFALRAVILVDDLAPARVPVAKPCACDGTCEAAFARAVAMPDDWRAWLAMRDACTLRSSRYSDEQIRYHYTKVWDATR
jgi:hypothetical protein